MTMYLANERVWFEGVQAMPFDHTALPLPATHQWFEGVVKDDDGAMVEIQAELGGGRYTVPREAVRLTPPDTDQSEGRPGQLAPDAP